jgi:hypothetical protein
LSTGSEEIPLSIPAGQLESAGVWKDIMVQALVTGVSPHSWNLGKGGVIPNLNHGVGTQSGGRYVPHNIFARNESMDTDLAKQ